MTEALDAPPPQRLPLLHRLWFGLCLAALAGCLGARAVYLAGWPLGAEVEAALRSGLLPMAYETVLVMPFDLSLTVLGGPMLLALAVVRLRWVLPKVGDVRHLAPWLHSAFWGVIVLNQGFFDLNPHLAAAGLTSLPFLLLRAPERSRWTRLAPVAWVGIWAASAGDVADAVLLLLWAALLWLAVFPGRRLLGLRDRFTLLVLLLPPLQVAPALLPNVLSLHDGNRLGDGMAYSYCESAQRNRLYATVPRCGTRPDLLEECKDGYVAEFDLDDLSLVAKHHVLDDEHYGRIEQLVCLEDSIQIGMNRTSYRGEYLLESAMAFDLDPPHAVRPFLLGEEGGHRIVHDEAANALLYLGDDVLRLHRVDRATGEMTRLEEEGPASERIVFGEIHPGRRHLFTISIETPIRAYDLDTLELLQSYPHGGGAELTVDAELDRVYATSFWGVEVIDLNTGRTTHRRRLGFIARKPVVDAKHSLVYVPTLGEGKLHVFDRDSFEYLGRIPLGWGSRYPHVTRDGERLLAGSAEAHYWWSTDALARRFRPDGG